MIERLYKWFFRFFLVGILLVATHPLNATDRKLYGLDDIQFDLLTELLLQKASELKKGLNGVDLETQGAGWAARAGQELRPLLHMKEKSEIFNRLMSFIERWPLRTENDYAQLAYFLIELREAFRVYSDVKDVIHRREILYLLQLIEEEVLYIGFEKNLKENSGNPYQSRSKTLSWLSVSEGDESDWGLVKKTSESEFFKDVIDEGRNHAGVIPFRGIPIMTGDIFLEKQISSIQRGEGTENAIFAMTGDSPHIVSTSKIAMVSTLGTNQILLSPHAGPRGVRLEIIDPAKYDRSSRLFVYRLNQKAVRDDLQLIDATQNFLATMFERVSDPFRQEAFSYNLEMETDRRESFYCASLSCQIYRQADLPEDKNPYPRFLWGQSTQTRRPLYDFLNLPQGPGAHPGDLEVNRNFKLVGVEIQIHNLERERVESAVIETFFDSLTETNDYFDFFRRQATRLGEVPISEEQIEKLVEKGELSQSSAARLPPSLTPKQILFYGFVNEIYLPHLREKVLKQVESFRNDGVVLGLQGLRTLAYESHLAERDQFKKRLRRFVSLLMVKGPRGKGTQIQNRRNKCSLTLK